MELQSLPTVPAGNVAGMIVSLLVAFGLPIGLYLYLKHKKYARTSSFVTGMLVFILFALVLETAVHSLVFSLAGTALTGNLFLYAVYAALMAAAFEETGRYLAMRFVLRHRFDGKRSNVRRRPRRRRSHDPAGADLDQQSGQHSPDQQRLAARRPVRPGRGHPGIRPGRGVPAVDGPGLHLFCGRFRARRRHLPAHRPVGAGLARGQGPESQLV